MQQEKIYRAELTACFGDPVDENPTGVIEEAGYKTLGLNYRYLTVRVEKDRLPDAVNGARAMGFRGFNLTIPHKVAVIPLLDELTEAARLIGAVNTVISENGKLIGENTDGKGFLTSLRDNGIDPAGKTITLLGAGGAARAVSVELALAGARHINIINRGEERGMELASAVSERTNAAASYFRWIPQVSIPEETNILVQCTNIGLFPDVTGKPDVNYDTLRPEMVAADVVVGQSAVEEEPCVLVQQPVGEEGAARLAPLHDVAVGGVEDAVLVEAILLDAVVIVSGGLAAVNYPPDSAFKKCMYRIIKQTEGNQRMLVLLFYRLCGLLKAGKHGAFTARQMLA